MRILTILIVVMATAWGGYWFVGSSALETGARDWFAAEAAAGRGARYGDLSVAGFPNRFDLTITDPHLESPDGAVVWDAPQAQIFALSYRPWHVIANLPQTQTLTIAGAPVTIASSRMQGSVVVKPTAAVALDRLSFVLGDLAVSSPRGWRFAAKAVDFATDLQNSPDNTHKIGLRVTDLVPDPAMMAGALGAAGLPGVIDLIYADSTVTFTAALDRFAGDTQPQVTRIDLTRVQITWGAFDLTGTGAITAGPDGLAEGRVDWSLRNWRMVPPVLVAAGLIKPEVEQTVAAMLQTLAAQSTDPEVLALPLVFQSGRTSLGPLPLGPAPRLR